MVNSAYWSTLAVDLRQWIPLVTVRLPIAASLPEEAQLEALPSDSQSNQSTLPVPAEVHRKVLVVDDNVPAARTLSLLLRKLGHEVQTVHDGAAAVEAAREFQPDLVLMDIGMPVMDGYQAAREIRSAAWGKSFVLVAISGWGQSEDIQRALDAGFDLHEVKPVDAATIRRLLRDLK